MFPKTHLPTPRIDNRLHVVKEEAALCAWDTLNGTTAELTLTGNRTIVIRTLEEGQAYNLFIIQDATGSRTLAFDTSLTIRWPAGVAPTLSTAAASVDMISFIVRRGILYGTFLKGFA
jgi:hypothetical protein